MEKSFHPSIALEVVTLGNLGAINLINYRLAAFVSRDNACYDALVDQTSGAFSGCSI